MTKGGGVWLGGAVWIVGIAATLLTISACGDGGSAPSAARPGEITGQVTGLVLEVVGRNIVEIETLRVRDADEKVWTFTAEGPLAFSPSHLREHQLFGQAVVVSYVRRGGSLVAIEIND